MRKVLLKFYCVYYRIKVKFMSDDAIIASIRKDTRRRITPSLGDRELRR